MQMHDLRKMLCDELSKVSKSTLTSNTLDYIDKLTHSILSIDTIMAMKDRGYEPGEVYEEEEDKKSFDEMKSKLKDMLEYSKTEAERDMIRNWMQQL